MKHLALFTGLLCGLAIAPGCIERVEVSAEGATSGSGKSDVPVVVAPQPEPKTPEPKTKTPTEPDEPKTPEPVDPEPKQTDPPKVDPPTPEPKQADEPKDPPPTQPKDAEPAVDSKGRPVAEKRPEKKAPRPTDKNKPYDITFDTIKFGIEKGEQFEREMLTEEIEGLVGQRVKIRGYMLPSFQQSGIAQFVLVRDNMECCFGPGAAIYDCVLIQMEEGRTTDYKIRPITVDGYFDIKPIEQDGTLLVLYQLRGLSVR